MKMIFVCSPYRGDIEENTKQAKRHCERISNYGHAPIAPHLFCTQFLDDRLSNQRNEGIRIGLEFLNRCDELWVCSETITVGMEQEIRHALKPEVGVNVYFYNELKSKGLI